jgi:hypothetical protein
MEVISIDGVDYVKASVIAKQFRYTSDYVGQLCRAHKVEAKLVGRTWYVNPLSIEGHKTTKYSKPLSAEKTTSINKDISVSRKDVSPVIRREPSKLVNPQPGSAQFLKRIVWNPVKYEADSSELLPPLRQGVTAVRLPVGIADGQNVAIKNLSKTTQLVSDPLPSVRMQGDITIESIDDDFEINPKNIDIPELFSQEVTRVPESFRISHTAASPTTKSLPHTKSKDIPDRYTYPVSVTSSTSEKNTLPPTVVPSFAPNRFSNASTDAGSASEVAQYSFSIYLLLLSIGMISMLSVLSVAKVVTIDQVNFSASYTVESPLSVLVSD